MKRKIAAAIALGGLLGACGDDGPTTLAQGEDVEIEGDQTLDISAEEEDGDVTGEVVFTDSVNGRQRGSGHDRVRGHRHRRRGHPRG